MPETIDIDGAETGASGEGPDRGELYLTLLNEHERRLAAYVHSLVPHAGDAADILQGCRITMWRKFSDFEPGTDFFAWARKVAFHQILNHRRSERRRPFSPIDERFLEAVAEEVERQSDQLAERSEALHACLRKLPAKQRSAVAMRYFDGLEIHEIARRTGGTEASVYKMLSRIRAALSDCIVKQVKSSPA
jgi:RNA polymerase sigma-70 factor (ECF subfamily)